VQIQILGQVRLRMHEQVDLGATKVRGLLGYLSYRVNELVHVDRIAEALWEGDQPSSPAKVLQTYVSRLRRVFRDAGCPADLRHEHRSYSLQADKSSVDYYAFLSKVRNGHRARGRGDHGEAAEIFTTALRMWTGPPRADLTLSYEVVPAMRFADSRHTAPADTARRAPRTGHGRNVEVSRRRWLALGPWPR
jgi:DNA-binding SARP family transcriptional activator